MLTATQYKRVKALFLEAEAQSPEERARSCGKGRGLVRRFAGPAHRKSPESARTTFSVCTGLIRSIFRERLFSRLRGPLIRSRHGVMIGEL